MMMWLQFGSIWWRRSFRWNFACTGWCIKSIDYRNILSNAIGGCTIIWRIHAQNHERLWVCWYRTVKKSFYVLQRTTCSAVRFQSSKHKQWDGDLRWQWASISRHFTIHVFKSMNTTFHPKCVRSNPRWLLPSTVTRTGLRKHSSCYQWCVSTVYRTNKIALVDDNVTWRFSMVVKEIQHHKIPS